MKVSNYAESMRNGHVGYKDIAAEIFQHWHSDEFFTSGLDPTHWHVAQAPLPLAVALAPNKYHYYYAHWHSGTREVR